MRTDSRDIMHFKIHPRRKDVLLMTLLFFICLGLWRWIEMKSSPFSLFDWWGVSLKSFPTDLGRGSAEEILLGLLFLTVWTVGYILISWALGWLMAAIIDAVRILFKIERKSNQLLVIFRTFSASFIASQAA